MAPAPQAPLPGGTQGIVTTQGTQFSLNGAPWHFSGTNLFDLAQVDAYSEDDVETIMADSATLGAQVVRFFAFSNGYGVGNVPTPSPIQPTVGTFSETALQRLDYVLARAQAHGLRVVMPMVNFEPTFGGMQWYVDSVVGTGQDRQLFYTDSSVKQAYKNYVGTLINRTNTQNGLRYAADPTILSWEMANEPHTDNLYEINRNMIPGLLVNTWLDEMSTWVRSQGVVQLISSGEEGYRADGDTTCCYNSWLNGGFKGVDFVKDIQLPHIDFATIHVYPDNWDFTPNNYQWVVPNFIGDRASIAHAAGKPIYMEEYGMSAGFLPDRATLLDALTEGAKQYNVSGYTVWSVHSLPITENGYNFDYQQSGGAAMQQLYLDTRTLNDA